MLNFARCSGNDRGLPDSRDRLPDAAFTRFSQPSQSCQIRQRRFRVSYRREKPRPACLLCEMARLTAQNPVTGLWMGCTRLRINKIEAPAFLLTPQLERVKRESF